MKKYLLAACSLLLIACCALSPVRVNAQKYAIIDTKYILDKMPDYKLAQKQLDDVAAGWQKKSIICKPSLIKCTKIMKLNR